MESKPKSDKKKVVSKKETSAKTKEVMQTKKPKNTPVFVSEKNETSNLL